MYSVGGSSKGKPLLVGLALEGAVIATLPSPPMSSLPFLRWPVGMFEQGGVLLVGVQSDPPLAESLESEGLNLKAGKVSKDNC